MPGSPVHLSVFDARILTASRITHATLRVYLAVMALGAWDGRHWTPIKTKPLAEQLGVSQKTVWVALRRLTEDGYLDRSRVGRWTLVRRYSALDPIGKGRDSTDDDETDAKSVTHRASQIISWRPSARQLLPPLA